MCRFMVTRSWSAPSCTSSTPKPTRPSPRIGTENIKDRIGTENIKDRKLCYSNADIRKGEEAEEIFRFIEFWTRQHGSPPQHLVFDSKLTTYDGLDRLDAAAYLLGLDPTKRIIRRQLYILRF